MPRITLLVASAIVGLSMNIRGESEGSIRPIADPASTGIWLQSLFTEDEGELRICQKPLENYDRARIPLAAKTEIQIRGNDVLINQEGLYPMCLGSRDSSLSIYMGTPFYAFLDYANGTNGMDGYAHNPKASSMNGAGLRVIAEKLHSHFTELAKNKPEWHRVIDDIDYPSEHYIWKIGSVWIILTANDGNDNDGLRLTLTKDNKRIDEIRTMKPTDKKMYAGWGDSLPHNKTR